MNILSLFDGISCGQVAANRSEKITVYRYFASEVEPNSIKITMKNHTNTKQLGDVSNWKEWDLDFSKIDLIMAGSPCQGFSSLGKRLAFKDEKSKLFYEFVDILKYIKSKNNNIKFLLENVRMQQSCRDTISGILEVDPVMINSSKVSAQQRRRLYWCNWYVHPPKNKYIFLEDILQRDHTEPNSDRWHVWFDKKRNHLLTNSYCRIMNNAKKSIPLLKRQFQDWQGNIYNLGGNKYRFATPAELERLQTLPDNYTDGISLRKRWESLGNAWTVDVIKHILNNMDNPILKLF